jgi:hypothetical protein
MSNYVGVAATGIASLANEIGVIMTDAGDNKVRGTTARARNVVSSGPSPGIGVAIIGSAATGDVVLDNYIGTDAPGPGSPRLPVGPLGNVTRS